MCMCDVDADAMSCDVVQIEFFGNHRNMTVSAPTLGLTITHRFTGHVDLKENMMGLDTFFHRDFQREFRCLTDPQPGQGCQKRRPDMLVVNSGTACPHRLAWSTCFELMKAGLVTGGSKTSQQHGKDRGVHPSYMNRADLGDAVCRSARHQDRHPEVCNEHAGFSTEVEDYQVGDPHLAFERPGLVRHLPAHCRRRQSAQTGMPVTNNYFVSSADAAVGSALSRGFALPLLELYAK